VTVVDLILVAVVLLCLWSGYYRGFILGLLDLARWAASLLAAIRFYQPVAQWLTSLGWSEVWGKPAAFLLVALVVSVLVQAAGHALLGRVSREAHRNKLNRALGVIPGAVSGLIMAAIISALLLATPLPEPLRESARASDAANSLAVYTERLENVLVPVFDEAARETFNRLTIRPGSDERVELPFTVADTRPRPELEARMLEMVNEERRAAGLSPLAPDPEMTEVARRHSADMFARGYFAHVTPEGADPFDRARAAGLSFRTAGENLALAPTLRIAHTGLMNSPGHRANILRPEFGRLGVGVMDGGARGLMVTQNFRN
jgi:uncharacterized protein YkwD